MERELVSIIITTCNGSDKLKRAIISALNQTYEAVEVIVVDDNGKGTEKQLFTQKMLSLFKNSNLKYIVHDINKNGAVARNTGAHHAKGVYLAFLDDDDLYFPKRIESCIKKAQQLNVDLVYSNVLFLRDDKIDSILIAEENGFTQADILKDHSLLGTGSNIFVSRNLYKKISGFDETFLRYQDVEFMIRALDNNRIAGITEYLVIKDITESRFYPKYKSFLQTQQQLLSKFNNEIEALPCQEKRQCFFSKRTELLYVAYMSAESANYTEAKKILKESVGKLKIKEQFTLSIKKIYLLYFYNIMAGMREKKHKKNMIKTQRYLGDTTSFKINELLRRTL